MELCATKWLIPSKALSSSDGIMSSNSARGDVCKVQPHMLAAIRFCEGHLGKLLHSISKAAGQVTGQRGTLFSTARAAGRVFHSKFKGSCANYILKNGTGLCRNNMPRCPCCAKITCPDALAVRKNNLPRCPCCAKITCPDALAARKNNLPRCPCCAKITCPAALAAVQK